MLAEARRDLVRAGTRAEQLEQVRAAVRQAQAAFDDAEREARRVEGLAAQGAVAGRELDQAAAHRDGARAALDAARQRLAEAEAGARVEDVRAAEAAVAQAAAQERAAEAALALAVAGPRRETLQGAEARVEAARGALAAAEALLAQTRIVAPGDGARHAAQRRAGRGGDARGSRSCASPSSAGSGCGSTSRSRASASSSSGSARRSSVDAFPGRDFPGVVTEIAEKPEFTPKNVQTREERVKLVFGVKVEVENPGGELKPGMPADAVISRPVTVLRCLSPRSSPAACARASAAASPSTASTSRSPAARSSASSGPTARARRPRSGCSAASSTPDGGEAAVAGFDVRREPEEVKRRIGYMLAALLALRRPDRRREPALLRRASTGCRAPSGARARRSCWSSRGSRRTATASRRTSRGA